MAPSEPRRNVAEFSVDQRVSVVFGTSVLAGKVLFQVDVGEYSSFSLF